jgi:hypothetical protein
MKVFMLGWEFPPFISGGLGTACAGLTEALAKEGTEILFVLPNGQLRLGPRGRSRGYEPMNARGTGVRLRAALPWEPVTPGGRLREALRARGAAGAIRLRRRGRIGQAVGRARALD